MGVLTGLFIVIWFLVALWAGHAEMFLMQQGEPPWGVILAIMIPILFFIVVYKLWPAFRGYILSVDSRLLTVVHSWRMLGAMFLVLMAYGILPKEFAVPAGIGDMIVAFLAPVVALKVADNPTFENSFFYSGFHLLGLLDFVLALTMGVLVSGAIPSLFSGNVDNSAMTILPLSIIPTFFVPLWSLTHVIALLKTKSGPRK